MLNGRGRVCREMIRRCGVGVFDVLLSRLVSSRPVVVSREKAAGSSGGGGCQTGRRLDSANGGSLPVFGLGGTLEKRPRKGSVPSRKWPLSLSTHWDSARVRVCVCVYVCVYVRVRARSVYIYMCVCVYVLYSVYYTDRYVLPYGMWYCMYYVLYVLCM